MDSKTWALGLGLIAIAFGSTGTEAHKAVTSRYDYNKDVSPVLSRNCGRCHFAGGPAPMSLLNYQDAVAWAEAIRDEVTAERMPPFPVSPNGPAIRGMQPMTAHDVDVVVTWASGGTPRGDAKLDVTPNEEHEPGWQLESPDLAIPMESAHTVAAGTLDETCDFTLTTGLTETKWVKAVDLVPGTETLVRDAVISVENGPVLALWQPGTDTYRTPSGTAFKLPAGTNIHLKIHYKKHYDAEQEAVSDQSTVGLYFALAPESIREMQSISLNSAGNSATLPGPARVVALRPSLDRAYASVAVDAVSPAGSRVPLLRLNGPRPQWSRRYWLQNPIEIAGGSRIEVSLTPLPSSVDEPKTTATTPLQIALDYIPE